MNRNLKKYTIKTLAIISLVFCLYGSMPVFVYSDDTGALKNYTVLSPLPGTVESDGSTTLGKYLPGLFNLLLGVSAVLAFVMITYAGIQYMTTDAVFKKTEARSTLNNAVGGLLLVLASYAILYTINPKILEFDLNIKRINFTKSPGVEGSSASTGGSASGSMSYTKKNGSTVYFNDCANPCVAVGKGGLNLPTTDGINSEMGIPPKVNEELGNKLAKLNDSLKKEGISWAVTEAWPPTLNHKSPDHKVGLTVDARPNNQTPANVVKFEELAKSANLRVVYEVKTDDEAKSMKDAGYTGTILVLKDKMVNGKIVPQITSPHFSVYNK